MPKRRLATPSLASLCHSLGASDIPSPSSQAFSFSLPAAAVLLPRLNPTPFWLHLSSFLCLGGSFVVSSFLGSIHGRPFRGDGRPIADGVESSVRHWWGRLCRALYHVDYVRCVCPRWQAREWCPGRMQNLPGGWRRGPHGGSLLLQGKLEGRMHQHANPISFEKLASDEQVFRNLKHVR